MTHAEIVALAFTVFASDIAAEPSITLRGGNHLDDYEEPPAFGPTIDAVVDNYLEQFAANGLVYVDAKSWRHYLPYLIEYALRHMQKRTGYEVIDALLNNLRPPDREPPRLGSLSAAQEAVVVQCLEALAFAEESAHQEFACQVIEEWWMPGALYRQFAKKTANKTIEPAVASGLRPLAILLSLPAPSCNSPLALICMNTALTFAVAG